MSPKGNGEGAGGGEFRVPSATVRLLVVLVVVIAAATATGAALLWPRGEAGGAGAGAGLEVYSATVVSITPKTCEATPDDRGPDGVPLKTVACAAVQVRLKDGPDAGSERPITVTSGVLATGLDVGEPVRVEHLPAEAGLGDSAYSWRDYDRQFPILALSIGFAVLVVAVARLRGLVALLGLGVAFLMVLVFLLPAVRHGENPALVAFVGSVAVMLVILYAAHGVSAKTTTALLGTVAGLAATTLLAGWAAHAAKLDGQTSSDAYVMGQLVGTRALAGIVLASLVLAGLGVLNDVTVTQASAVWELHAVAPTLGPVELFRRGMRIGRDHLASTVYTIAFAYAAVSLQSLMLLEVYGTPWALAITSGAVAQEVVGVLVGGIGLVLAIPLTTAIAAGVVSTATTAPAPQRRGASDTPVPRVPGDGSEFIEGVLVRRRRDLRAQRRV